MLSSIIGFALFILPLIAFVVAVTERPTLHKNGIEQRYFNKNR